jgi:CHASE2 domain-containing sensor protein
VSLAELRDDVVILACAVSAGIHGALAPGHFAEGTGAGAGFVAAAVVLAVLALVLSRHPASALALAGTAAVFVGLLASYALATTKGLPVLHPDPEPVDGLALATKAIEAVGLLAALSTPKGSSTWTPHGLRALSRSR